MQLGNAARRTITDVEQKVKTFGNEQQTATYAREYVVSVETDIPEIRDGNFALMEKDLISSASGRVEGVILRILAEPRKRHDETAGDVEGCDGGGDGGEKKSWAETGEPDGIRGSKSSKMCWQWQVRPRSQQ